MMFVMSPFVLTGAPVLSSIISDDNQGLDTTRKWLKYVMTTPKLLPVNGLGVVITSGLNLWMFYLLFDIFVKLFILGEVPKHFLDTLYEIFEVIPIVLAVDLFWIKGYLLKDVIYRLDTISLDPNESNTRPVVIKLIVIYVLCLSLHVINYFTFQWRLQFGYTSETSEEYLEHLPHRLVNTFLIPVYITFCCVSLH